MNKNKKQAGFSLIELLVVVAIIGILAAAGVVGYQNYTDQARENVASSNQGAVFQFVATTASQLQAGIALPTTTNLSTCENSTNADFKAAASGCAFLLSAKFRDDGFDRINNDAASTTDIASSHVSEAAALTARTPTATVQTAGSTFVYNLDSDTANVTYVVTVLNAAGDSTPIRTVTF